MLERFKKLPYKKRNVLLVVGFGLAFILLYVTTLHKTVTLVKNNATLEKTAARASNATTEIALFQEQLALFNRKLGSFELDSIITHEHAFNVISDFCARHKLVIESFPDATTEERKEFFVHTSEIRVRGDFHGLLGLVYHLEQKERIGRLASVEFKRVKDRQTKRQKLTATLFLQNIQFKNT